MTLRRIEVTYLDGAVEVVEGDDVRVHGDALHVWNRHYNTAASGVVPDQHAGSWPLRSIRRWRELSE